MNLIGRDRRQDPQTYLPTGNAKRELQYVQGYFLFFGSPEITGNSLPFPKDDSMSRLHSHVSRTAISKYQEGQSQAA